MAGAASRSECKFPEQRDRESTSRKDGANFPKKGSRCQRTVVHHVTAGLRLRLCAGAELWRESSFEAQFEVDLLITAKKMKSAIPVTTIRRQPATPAAPCKPRQRQFEVTSEIWLRGSHETSFIQSRIAASIKFPCNREVAAAASSIRIGRSGIMWMPAEHNGGQKWIAGNCTTIVDC